MASKGGPFEREVCKRLSAWWSDGANDFVFWRSNTSGAMATVRGRKGKDTAGHRGDVTNVHESGKPLIDLVSLELKFGYATQTVQDLLDRGPKQPNLQPYEEFIDQAVTAAAAANAPYWWLIHRRKKRQSVILFPREFYAAAKFLQGRLRLFPAVTGDVFVRGVGRVRFGLCPLEVFLAAVPPALIRRLWREWRKGQ